MPHWYLGLVYEQQGEYPRALGEFQIAFLLSGGSPAPASSMAHAYAIARDAASGGNPVYLSSLGHAYAVMGNVVEARKALAELDELSRLRYVSPYERAIIHLGLGETEQALVRLEAAYQERSGWLIYLQVEPRLHTLRTHPRLVSLANRVGLTP
jgi:tetratricopeptide (TPR) repeat protein